MTDIAGDIDIGQELHFNFNLSISLARFTPTTFYIKAKSTRAETTHLCIFCICKNFSDVVKDFGVGCGVRSWRFSDWALIDHGYTFHDVWNGDG